MNNIGRITIIIPYFGNWPPWADYFFLSCRYNPHIDWMFFTDCPTPGFIAENLHFKSLSLKELNRLISRKLDMNIDIRYPYKLCDFKPAYGHIFEDYLTGSEFWGYGDMDLVYGNIKEFFPEGFLKDYDIVSNHSDFITGHLCILRNNPQLTRLYRTGGAYRGAFQNPYYKGFDEQLKGFGTHPDPGRGRYGKRLDLEWHILVNSLIRPLRGTRRGMRFRSQQKKKKAGLRDFTTIVRTAELENNLRVHRLKTFQSDLMLRKKGIKNWAIHWMNGNLSNRMDQERLLYFHFLTSKSRKKFRITPMGQYTKSFTLSRSGINPDTA